MSLRLALGGGPRDEERAGILANALDHLVRRMITNAGTAHAGKIFLDACEHNGTLTMEEPDVVDRFLDRLLPALEHLDRLPPNLVPFMIREFGWPQALGEVAATAALRPDVRDLLERHARESWIVHDDKLLVNKDIDRLLMRRALVGFAVAVFIALLIVGGKMLYRWGLWSSSV